MQGSIVQKERAVYNLLKSKYPGYTIAPGFLRVEKTLDNNSSKYKFNIQKTGNEGDTEIKLDRNDLFVVSHLGIFLQYQDTDEPGKNLIQAYPSPDVFGTNSGFSVDDMYALYAGRFNLKVGTEVVIDNLSMYNFLRVPETQQRAAQTAGSSATEMTTQGIAKDAFKLMDMVYHLPTLIYMKGSDDIEAAVEYPSFSGIQIAATASGYTNELVFMPFGFILKGAAR